MKILVTGGAGFIGSRIVDALVAEGHSLRVLDDLSSGSLGSVPPDAEFIDGTVVDERAVRAAVDDVEVVFHQAAHRAVLRSVEHPLTTDQANTHGTLTVLTASAAAGVRRVIYASSSSVYGIGTARPAAETQPPRPRSPNAVTKLAGEHYCRVLAELQGLETVALRYFNVYGPRQRPDSPYAEVIPLFMQALAKGAAPNVNGDGRQSRDFTYIDDVVLANLAAARAPASSCSGKAYNVAGGAANSLLELLDILGETIGIEPRPTFSDPRPGDVHHTRAEITAARRDLGHTPRTPFPDGLRRTLEWFATETTRSAV
jgi:UDP-glucose 4-epimerase